jgi:uncharacterized repeat protein (TIGR03843 family)
MNVNPNDSSSQPISVQRVLEVLQQGTIEADLSLMAWSSNYTFRVTICQELVTLDAIYKPHRGERPLWDFPEGMLCKRELASFLTSEELGWQIVPPTVLRDGPHGFGSLQFYIHHDPEVHFFTFDESKTPQIMRIAAFDYLVNNADRKGGHCLLDSQGHVWGIDHGITFHSAPKLRSVIWDFAGQPLPELLLPSIEKLCKSVSDSGSQYRKALSELLTEREIAAFQSRVQHLLKNKKYPRPGPGGPNYPWPPI